LAEAILDSGYVFLPDDRQSGFSESGMPSRSSEI
jgi:hypothetical protein